MAVAVVVASFVVFNEVNVVVCVIVLLCEWEVFQGFCLLFLFTARN